MHCWSYKHLDLLWQRQKTNLCQYILNNIPLNGHEIELWNVNLADDEAPILSCPNIFSTMDKKLNSSSTVLLNPTVTDNVDFDLDVICSHSSEDKKVDAIAVYKKVSRNVSWIDNVFLSLY